MRRAQLLLEAQLDCKIREAAVSHPPGLLQATSLATTVKGKVIELEGASVLLYCWIQMEIAPSRYAVQC